MFHEDSFSLDSFSTDSWLFLLEVPYFDLTGKQRVYVRHVLQSVYAPDVVEQIVSVAERHNLSAVDSVEVFRAQAVDQTLFVLPRKTVAVENPTRQSRPIEQKQANETRSAYAVHGIETMHPRDKQLQLFADFKAVESIVSSHAPEIIFITKKQSRSAHNNP